MPSAITPVLAISRKKSQSCMVPVAWALATISGGTCWRMNWRVSSLYSSTRLSTSKSMVLHRHRKELVGKRQVLVLGVLVDERPAPRPPVVQLDVVLPHDAVATVEVQRPGGGRLGQLGGEQERHGRQPGPVARIVVARPRRLANEQTGAVDGANHVGQTVLHRLERPDRTVELVAGDGVLHPQFLGLGGHADEGGRRQHLPLVDGG